MMQLDFLSLWASGTVIYGRVCLYSRGDLQIHLFVVLINCSSKSGWSVVTHNSMWQDVKEELRFGFRIRLYHCKLFTVPV